MSTPIPPVPEGLLRAIEQATKTLGNASTIAADAQQAYLAHRGLLQEAERHLPQQVKHLQAQMDKIPRQLRDLIGGWPIE